MTKGLIKPLVTGSNPVVAICAQAPPTSGGVFPLVTGLGLMRSG